MSFFKKDQKNTSLNTDLRYFDESQIKNNFWLRFKKFLLVIKKSIHDFGTKRISVFVVPHSGKKAINMHLSNYIMFFAGVIFTVAALSAVYVIASYHQNSRNHVRLIVENIALEEKFFNVSQTVDSLSDYFSQFRLEVESIINTPTHNNNSLNDPELALQIENDIPAEIIQLRKLEKELDVTKEQIFHIGNFMQENQRFMREIPSLYPLSSRGRITSRFGIRRNPFDKRGFEGHEGLDLAHLPGTPIYATADGVIMKAGIQGGYGNYIEIQHKYGFRTRYGHLQGFAAQVYSGARVKQGQVIGYVGATGRVTGYHLHYEVLIGGSRVDPEPFAMMLR